MKEKKQPSAVNVGLIDNFYFPTNYQDLIEQQHNRINDLESAMQEFNQDFEKAKNEIEQGDIAAKFYEKFQQLLPKPEEA